VEAPVISTIVSGGYFNQSITQGEPYPLPILRQGRQTISPACKYPTLLQAPVDTALGEFCRRRHLRQLKYREPQAEANARTPLCMSGIFSPNMNSCPIGQWKSDTSDRAEFTNITEHASQCRPTGRHPLGNNTLTAPGIGVRLSDHQHGAKCFVARALPRLCPGWHADSRGRWGYEVQ